jgi:hypothetical protein
MLQPTRTVRIVKRLNLRALPSAQSGRVGRLEPEQHVPVDAVVQGEPFLDRAAWYRVAGGGQYFWSGGAELEEAAAAVPPAPPHPGGVAASDVRRRPNGTILPLDSTTIASVYGAFTFEPGGSTGAVRITTPGWQAEHVVEIDHPVLRAVKRHPPAIHRLAQPHLKRVLDAIAAAGLAPLILTFDGSFVPRFKNWNPASGQLSAHSWGIAIDLNARFNGANREPALPGERGCLRELVPYFNDAGFAWGGHFSSNVDGMHFELARRNP